MILLQSRNDPEPDGRRKNSDRALMTEGDLNEDSRCILINRKRTQFMVGDAWSFCFNRMFRK